MTEGWSARKEKGCYYSLMRRGVKRGFGGLETSMKHLRLEQIKRLTFSVTRVMELLWRMSMA